MNGAEGELSPFTPENRILREDIDHCLAELQKCPEENCQFFRRVFVRATFAYIEGTIFQFKQSTAGLLLVQHIQSLRNDSVPLKPSPYTGFLCERDFALDDNGVLQEKTQFIPLKTNVQYTFKVAAETYRSTYSLDKTGQGWQAFLRATKVRDRITHPKDPVVDMAISTLELEDVKSALVWFEKAFKDLFAKSDFKGFLHSLQHKKTVSNDNSPNFG